MLAFALVPTLSRALAGAGGGSRFAEVCTPQGVKRVASDSPDSSAPAPQVPDACALCALAADGAAPLPASAADVVPATRGTTLPVQFLRAPHTLHAWARAQPRAPPARS